MDFKKFATASALFAFLTTVAASVSIPNGEVPITLQSVFVILAGLIAGANVGLTAQLIYLLVGVFSPVFAGEIHGMDILGDPTVGFLFAFPVAAFLAGYIGHQQNIWKIMLAVTIAQTSLYVFGVIFFKINTEITFKDAFEVAFINIAFWGYLKSTVTGLLYFGYLQLPRNKQAISNRK